MVPNFRCLLAREKFVHQIIAMCVIHSIIVGLSLELAGLRDNGALLCQTHVLSFEVEVLLCQTQESCAQFRSVCAFHVIIMFRVRSAICQGEKQRLSLELAGRSPEDGALLSQAQESRSQSRASAHILCVPSWEFIVSCPDHVDLFATYM